MNADRAMGICTLVMIWMVMAPADSAASTVAAETALMPSATILIAAGAAYAIAATMAVNRVAPNSASTGMR